VKEYARFTWIPYQGIQDIPGSTTALTDGSTNTYRG